MSKILMIGNIALIPTGRVAEVDKLAITKDGVLNIPRNDEDVFKSTQWFQNQLVCPIVVIIGLPKISYPYVDMNNLDLGVEFCQDLESLQKMKTLQATGRHKYATVAVGTDHISTNVLEQLVNKQLADGNQVIFEVDEFLMHNDRDKVYYRPVLAVDGSKNITPIYEVANTQLLSPFKNHGVEETHTKHLLNEQIEKSV
jgi:hypothetical protein